MLSSRKQCLLVDLHVKLLSWLGPEGSTTVKAADSGRLADGNSPVLSGITVDKSVEFTYEELATATNDFSIANKIGQGGFGAVYYAELRGEVWAILKSLLLCITCHIVKKCVLFSSDLMKQVGKQ